MKSTLMKPSIVISCLLVIILINNSCNRSGGPQDRPENPFAGRVKPLSINGSFRMQDHIVWGGSVIRHDDGKYYMFVSFYPDSLGRNNWIVNSKVALAVSDTPEGPYEFVKEVLPYRGSKYWDGMMTHNPTIHRHGDTYYLFYIGNTYDFERPEEEINRRDPRRHQAHSNQRIGVATATHPEGPWKRYDQPILEPREGHWDVVMTTNPAPVIHEDGSVTLIYKSMNIPYPERLEIDTKDGLPRFIIGAARAENPLGPYERLGEKDGLIFIEGRLSSLEDPYVWRQGERYHMIIKNFETDIIKDKMASIYVWSENGWEWYLPEGDPTVYTRTVTWQEGHTTTQQKLERPQVLLENGKPSCIFLGTGFTSEYLHLIDNPIRWYNVVFEVKSDESKQYDK